MVVAIKDSNDIENYRPFKKNSLIQLLLNAPQKEKRIDLIMVRKIDGIQIILVNDQGVRRGSD